LIANFFNRVVFDCESVSEDNVVSNNESDNEFFKDLLNINIDCLNILSKEVTQALINHPSDSSSTAVLLSNITASSDEVKADEEITNEVTAVIIPPSVSSSTDVLLSNITDESLPGSGISISLQKGKDLMSVFKTMYVDFYNAGDS